MKSNYSHICYFVCICMYVFACRRLSSFRVFRSQQNKSFSTRVRKHFITVKAFILLQLAFSPSPNSFLSLHIAAGEWLWHNKTPPPICLCIFVQIFMHMCRCLRVKWFCVAQIHTTYTVNLSLPLFFFCPLMVSARTHTRTHILKRFICLYVCM